MNKKIFSITSISIGVIALICAISAGAYTIKQSNSLSKEIGKIQQKQEEFSNQLQKIAKNITPTEENNKDSNGDSSNKDETKDWKVYRDEDLGFAIKYPKEFTTPAKMEYKGDKLVEFGDLVTYIFIKVEKKSLEKSILDIVKTNLRNHYSPLAYKTYKTSEINIKNKKGLRVTFQDDMGGVPETLITDSIEYNGKIYSITTTERKKLMSVERFHELVVSTFNFLDK